VAKLFPPGQPVRCCRAVTVSDALSALMRMACAWQVPFLVAAWQLVVRLVRAWEAQGRDVRPGALPAVHTAAGRTVFYPASSGAGGPSSDGARAGGDGVDGPGGIPHPAVELEGTEWLSVATRVAALAHSCLGAAKRCADDEGTPRRLSGTVQQGP
jgi:hypothetical protein